ncbi:glycoside hydrolase family 3 C-terminal domain-containing protein [Asanoa sp. WMMD1127]|uniref:beta-glucosidase family protein n=1 Tax=Asanoa sp. WMMD1127 TaxID=3016107 RepID=UPI002416AE5E|nr:glycoside hydrolase family 3 C-terminal domain-containing protein [Asanoa sp. WMMD1127]MDG4827608.1 glycoside hydrolase family 3 C-terminal domain-containing protein [Asanoa sp. WMMD1127]
MEQTAHQDAIESALAALDLETKIRLLTGQDYWRLPAVPEIGLAELTMSDGPIGVRGVRWSPDNPSVALPSPTALAATWDPELSRLAGRVLGQECRARGIHILLAPTVNLHRSPLAGRHFECYSEDPLLTAAVGIGYVTGLQDQGVGAQVKHYVANDSETERFTVDVRVSQRALRELYLVPFERIVDAGVWSLMAAYNGVNGSPMTEQDELVNGLLKSEWGFDGAVVSDWTAARTTVPTATGGLDVVMPAFAAPWGDQLLAAVRAGEVTEDQIDDKVRRILLLAGRVGAWDRVPPAVPVPAATGLDVDAAAREIAARSFVLARNTDEVLPLSAGALRKVAVLGALADDARIQGGGSARVLPRHIVSPLAGLTAALPDAEVVYAVGADPRPELAAATGLEWTPITTTLRDAGGNALYEATIDAGDVRWMGELPEGVDPAAAATVEISATFTPSVTGTHQLAANGFGNLVLRVGEETLFDQVVYAPGDDPVTTAFLTPVETRCPVEAIAGKPVDVSLTHQIYPGRHGFVTLTLGHGRPVADDETLLDEAARVAAEADVAVVVVGTTEEVESEGFDRTSLALPGRQDELVARVAAANPRTVVVVNAGSPVLMPWVDDVAAVLLTWFPGQEAGAALADVLLGVVEPGGRLPTTWPRATDDVPVLSTTPEGGTLTYAEDVLIGYRGWTAEPLFPFGHGLGYTTWAYESLDVEAGQVVVTVRNTGARPGRQVVQVYVGPTTDGGPVRPERWLAGFAAVTAAPDEAVTVRIPLPERTFQVWDDGGWRTVSGTYRVEASAAVTDPRLTATVDV